LHSFQPVNAAHLGPAEEFGGVRIPHDVQILD
jgi:hypothetical protein